MIPNSFLKLISINSCLKWESCWITYLNTFRCFYLIITTLRLSLWKRNVYCTNAYSFHYNILKFYLKEGNDNSFSIFFFLSFIIIYYVTCFKIKGVSRAPHLEDFCYECGSLCKELCLVLMLVVWFWFFLPHQSFMTKFYQKYTTKLSFLVQKANKLWILFFGQDV